MFVIHGAVRRTRMIPSFYAPVSPPPSVSIVKIKIKITNEGGEEFLEIR